MLVVDETVGPHNLNYDFKIGFCNSINRKNKQTIIRAMDNHDFISIIFPWNMEVCYQM